MKFKNLKEFENYCRKAWQEFDWDLGTFDRESFNIEGVHIDSSILAWQLCYETESEINLWNIYYDNEDGLWTMSIDGNTKDENYSYSCCLDNQKSIFNLLQYYYFYANLNRFNHCDYIVDSYMRQGHVGKRE